MQYPYHYQIASLLRYWILVLMEVNDFDFLRGLECFQWKYLLNF